MKHEAGGIAERSETPSRLVINEEFSQISGSFQNLKQVQENFESYPTINWQPLESFKKWAGIYSQANSQDGDDITCTSNMQQTMNMINALTKATIGIAC